jgi:hypothetical protein
MATFIGATMWFWILLRAKEDGGVLLVRWRRSARAGPAPSPLPPLLSLSHPTRPPSLTQGLHKPWEAHAHHEEEHHEEEHHAAELK